MNQRLLIAGALVAVGPVRRTLLRPVAKLAVKAGLNVADTAANTVKGIGDVYTEARDEHRGADRATPSPAPAPRRTTAKAGAAQDKAGP